MRSYPHGLDKRSNHLHYRAVFPQFEEEERGRNKAMKWVKKSTKAPATAAQTEATLRKTITWPTEKEVDDELNGEESKACNSKDLQNNQAKCEEQKCRFKKGKKSSCVDKPRKPIQENDPDTAIAATIYMGWRKPEDFKASQFEKESGKKVKDNGCYRAFGDWFDGAKAKR